MDGSFKNIARITLVLTVGLLAATGVGPRSVTQATHALTNSKPAQSAGYALQTFFDRFAPAQTDDIQPDRSNSADIRLASTSSPAASSVQVASIESTIDLSETEERGVDKTLTCELTETPSIEALQGARHHATLKLYTVASAPRQPARTLARAPLPARLATTATAHQFPGFHHTILRLMGITTATRLSRFAFEADESALFLVPCDDPAS